VIPQSNVTSVSANTCSNTGTSSAFYKGDTISSQALDVPLRERLQKDASTSPSVHNSKLKSLTPLSGRSDEDISPISTTNTTINSGHKFTFKKTANSSLRSCPKAITHTAGLQAPDLCLDIYFDDFNDDELFPELDVPAGAKKSPETKSCDSVGETRSRHSFSSKLSAKMTNNASHTPTATTTVKKSGEPFEKPAGISTVQNYHNNSNNFGGKAVKCESSKVGATETLTKSVAATFTPETNLSKMSTRSRISPNILDSSIFSNTTKTSVPASAQVQDQLREERLRRQQEKQAEFRRKMAEKQSREETLNVNKGNVVQGTSASSQVMLGFFAFLLHVHL
jgi:hypothetical protein